MESMLYLAEAVSFAIKRGASSLSYYTRCASAHAEEGASKLFEDLCSHEHSQQIRLLEAKSIIRKRCQERAIPFGRIRAYLVDAQPADSETILQSLFWASVRSETSLQLYYQIGLHIEEGNLKRVFVLMAHEEMKYKRIIEQAYDELLVKVSQPS